ncbi:hypothetical protein PIB30_026905 [Stylosanthes scabra]|uniref:Uncharacterized protein n=1 Tax=Stylosanthes scabra TaxID=79078 RepID=A0ABU6W8H0_9FABA|nr:hypothetical protein [Stylosanthes scabra]
MDSVLNFPVHEHPGPDQEFLEWLYGLPHRFLSPVPLLGDPRGREVDEVVATWGSQVPPHRTQVPDVPNRRGVERRRRVGTRLSQRPDGDGDGAKRVRRAQFRPPGERRPRGRGRGRRGRGEAGHEHEVAEDEYVPLGDDQLGGGMISPHQLYPDFASPGTMERQLGGRSATMTWLRFGRMRVVRAGPSVPSPEVPQPLVQDPPEDPPADEYDIPLARRLRRAPRR